MISSNEINIYTYSGCYHTRQYIRKKEDTNTYILGKREQNGCNLFSTEILSDVLNFINSIDIHKMDLIIRNITTEYDLYPLEMVEDACRCLIAIRLFRESALSILPKDVVKLITKELWKTRKDIRGWIPFSQLS